MKWKGVLVGLQKTETHTRHQAQIDHEGSLKYTKALFTLVKNQAITL